MTDFYDVMTTRNIGFITEAEQLSLKQGSVLVVGVGGMGGAAVQMLVRAGVGNIAIADIDIFEISNINRQVFAFTDTSDRLKTEVTAEGLKRINPGLNLKVYGAEWTEDLDDLAKQYSVIINGCDDIPATAHLYRKAKQHGATIIDAYASPLPSVIVVRPNDPRPEDRLGYPIKGIDWKSITEDQAAACFMKELEWVMTHSSSHTHIDLTAAAEMAAGKRKRMSFAPMVTTAGCLMAGEALSLLMGRKTKTDYRGWFLNTRDARCERPLPGPIGNLKAIIVRRFMQKLLSE